MLPSYMMVAGGEKERGQGEKKKKKKPYSSRQLPEKQSPDRLKHVCICQHLAVTTSCICQISQHAKQKEATLCEVLSADFYKEMTSGVGAI